MVTFISLFLGLLIGSHPVELAVSGEVSTVEILLDGRTLVRLSAPPWIAECDFGDELRPHELVAVAYDEKGEEVSRVRQWVNLPRQRAESTLVLELDSEGRPAALRLIWENLEALHPLAIRVTLDGGALTSTGGGIYPLPQVDLSRMHIASAEIEFEEGPIARSELVFGGPAGDRIEVEMTAVPVRWRAPRSEPDVAAFAGGLGREGRPLRVLGLERGRGRVVTVLENGALPILRGFGLALDAGSSFDMRRRLPLMPGESLLAQTTVAERRGHQGTPLDLFTITPPYQAEHGDLPFLISHAGPTEVPPGKQQVADAVAVAAVEAAAGNRPRVVVLILGSRWSDQSRFKVAEVRRFVGHLRVPLIVWATGPRRTGLMAEDRIPLSRKTTWGRARDVSTLFRFFEAVTELRRELDRQAVAWVGGAHPPQMIELLGSVDRFELAD